MFHVGEQRHWWMRTAKHVYNHFAHEVIQISAMWLVKVPTYAQLTDILTKGLHLTQHNLCGGDPGMQEDLKSFKGTSIHPW